MDDEERSFFLERKREIFLFLGGGGRGAQGRNGSGNVIFLGGGGLVGEVVGGLGMNAGGST